jgi:hypothetical protein
MPTQPTIQVEIAFVNSSSSVFNALLAWTDVTADVISIATRRGRSQEMSRFEAGTATIVLDNATGDYTPGNTTGIYYLTDGLYAAPYLSPFRPIRIRATWSAVTYDVWYGYIESWNFAWPGGAEGTVTLACVDGFKILAQAIVTYSEAAQIAGTRIANLVAALPYSWPVGYTDIQAASRTMAAVSLAATSPLSHMQDVAVADNGQLFMAGDGKLTYHSLTWRTTDTESTTPQATFGYDPSPTIGWVLGDSVLSVLGTTTIPRGAGWPSASTTEVPYLSVRPSLDDHTILNYVTITGMGGGATPQVASSVASIAQFGYRYLTATYILDINSQALDRANEIIAARAIPIMRIDEITMSGHQTDNLWPIMLALQIDYRVRVIIRPMNTHPIVADYFVEAVAHGPIANDEWVLTLSLSPAP